MLVKTRFPDFGTVEKNERDFDEIFQTYLLLLTPEFTPYASSDKNLDLILMILR